MSAQELSVWPVWLIECSRCANSDYYEAPSDTDPTDQAERARNWFAATGWRVIFSERQFCPQCSGIKK